MVISAVRSRAVSLPLAPVPYSTERGGTKREWGMTRLTPHRPEPSLEYVIVEIDTDAGITGVGEACTDIGFFGEPVEEVQSASDRYLGPALLGEDPFDREHLLAKIDFPGNSCAKSGIDLALHDLLGKALGVPVCNLIGGSRRRQVFAVMEVSGGAPDGMARQCVDWVEQGVRGFKAKVGAIPEEDADRLAAIRDAVGPDIFDVVVREENLRSVRDLLAVDQETIGYWRNVLRVAALCHDVGHLPFSHAAESELLPSGWNHERLTMELIMDGPLSETIQSMKPPITPSDVAKIAVSPSILPHSVVESLTDWETIVAEIISGPVFGADRMDYLLRDSHHIGVAYGRYDLHRLIDTIRILPSPPAPPTDDCESSQSRELTLGVELGGLQTAESLLVARYFMFKQVYFHHVRRIYDLHLLDFLKLWLPKGRFPTETNKHMAMSDPAIIAEMQSASVDKAHRAHDAARRFITRKHFRHVYSPRPDHLEMSQDPGEDVFLALVDVCGHDNVKHDVNYDAGGSPDFPVVRDDGSIVSALSVSDVLKDMPLSFDSVYVAPEMVDHAHKYLSINTERILGGSSS